MKKLFKITGVVLGLLSIGLLIFGWFSNEPLPEGKSGPEADALARTMLKAMNYDKYKNTRFLEWSYQGGTHQYKWDKAMGKVEVKWSDYTVDLDLNETSKSIAFENSTALPPKENRDIVNVAWEYFNNDSFWLVAPFKVFDEGVQRSLVELEDGSDGLLVTYTTGGTTPGDSYLWKLQPNGFPYSFKMWVKIIPIGGLEATWDDWQIMESGTFLPKSHKLGPITLEVGNPKAYN
ncbi:hypothetical protein [Costertonia aggregata]|uniref:Uncharacterized protein n=1 Tax=Costertonia aggregata TaxID=343403 RepID=A0A7H9AUQ3_9FLAO|nr:hypothetical protein [Costertonia aggregata]QLG47002.1 hypothetical protein HYG79_17115 [Costertonia aggregata]